MKKIRISLLIAGVAAFCTVLFFACQKSNSSPGSSVNNSPNKQNVSLVLTDGPAFFDSVYIDIQSISVVIDTCDNDSTAWMHSNSNDTSCNIWEQLNFNAGVYNLLSLRNGVDSLLATGNGLPAGKLKLIKIEIGSHNYVVKDSVQYPLHLTGNKDSVAVFISLQGNECYHFGGNNYRLWLDFDLGKSITGNGNWFFFNPFIHFYNLMTTGSVAGITGPMFAKPIITVYNASDTVHALPTWGGVYMARGLSPGTYNVLISSASDFQDTTVTNVNVIAGTVTKLAPVFLKP